MNESNTDPSRGQDILIVEDSPTQAERLKFVLEQADYSYRVARNGLEALEAIACDVPAMVISDVVMPEMDGYELCRRLKADTSHAKIPFIFLTTLSDPVDVVKGLECEADDFIFKPYAEEYLLLRITAGLDSYKMQQVTNPNDGVAIKVAGRIFTIHSNRERILNLLLSTYEAGVGRNREVAAARDELRRFSEQLEVRVRERTTALERKIEEHKQANILNEEQARLLDLASDAIIERDLEGKAVFWSAGAERLYGWKREEAVGQDMCGKTFQDMTLCDKALAETMNLGEWKGEIKQVSRDNSPLTVASRWTLVRNPDDSPRSVLIINTDITEAAKVEQQLQRSQRMESIGTLAGGIAHDLNNVLAPILMSAELLRRELKDERALKIIGMVESSARRGASLVKQVLTFARGAEGKKGPLQLKKLINDTEGMIYDAFPKNINFKAEVDPDLWEVSGDETQVY